MVDGFIIVALASLLLSKDKYYVFLARTDCGNETPGVADWKVQ